jgi:hypothetical protein
MTPDEIFEKWINLAWPGLKPTSDRYELAKAAFTVGRASVKNPEELIAELDAELQRRRDEFAKCGGDGEAGLEQPTKFELIYQLKNR